eukprot:scaffold3852_cov129-Isochrysis_galbana.AAC.1
MHNAARGWGAGGVSGYGMCLRGEWVTSAACGLRDEWARALTIALYSTLYTVVSRISYTA